MRLNYTYGHINLTQNKTHSTINPYAKKKSSENVVCWSRLLQIIAQHDWRIKYRSKQCGPRLDCSYRISLICVHTVCHREFLNISADETKQTTFVAIGAFRVNIDGNNYKDSAWYTYAVRMYSILAHLKCRKSTEEKEIYNYATSNLATYSHDTSQDKLSDA